MRCTLSRNRICEIHDRKGERSVKAYTRNKELGIKIRYPSLVIYTKYNLHTVIKEF